MSLFRISRTNKKHLVVLPIFMFSVSLLIGCSSVSGTKGTGTDIYSDPSLLLSQWPNERVCENAILKVYSKVNWYSGHRYYGFVREAQIRGLTILDCARILGWENVDVLQYKAPNYQVSEMKDVDVCRKATWKKGKNYFWITLSNFSEYFNAARKRGLSITDCAALLCVKCGYSDL